MSAGLIFKGPEEFDIFSDATAIIVSVLNQGRTGPTPVSIHASRKGYRITIRGAKLAEGKTPKELKAAFERAVENARKKANG